MDGKMIRRHGEGIDVLGDQADTIAENLKGLGLKIKDVNFEFWREHEITVELYQRVNDLMGSNEKPKRIHVKETQTEEVKETETIKKILDSKCVKCKVTDPKEQMISVKAERKVPGSLVIGGSSKGRYSVKTRIKIQAQFLKIQGKKIRKGSANPIIK